MNEKIMAIINPVSLNGKTGKRWPLYEKYFHDMGIELEKEFTQYPGHAIKLSREAVEMGYRRIMAVGGDGTINEVVNGFYEDDKILNDELALIVFSQGTGCDYIKSLGIGNRVEEIVDIIQRGKVKKVDLGKVTYQNYSGSQESRYFVNVADTGIGACTAKLVNESSKLLGGFLSYLIGVFKALIIHKNRKMRVIIDGKEEYNQYLNSVIIANGKYFGGGIMIAPEAELSGGNFNLVLLKNFKKFQIVVNLVKAYQGTHLNHPLVDSLYGREVYLELNENAAYELELDGESVGLLPAQFKILQEKLPVMI